MEQSFKPDRKYFTKVLWMELTITVLVLISLAIIHLIIHLADGDPRAPFIVWLVGVICLVLMWIITTPIAYLWIINLEYIIHGDRIKIHKGILTKIQQNIPFRSITDFALERTLYDRILNIGSIKIQTAGQAHTPTGYEGKLAGLVEYEKWHNELRERVKVLHPISEALTTAEKEPASTSALLEQILNELKKIRKNTAKS